MKNIYLIGMMGAGKTTTGQELAKLLSYTFVDLDDLIVEEAGQSINEIFKSKGEPYFRTKEREILTRISSGSRQVVATGGGVVLDAANRERMQKTGMAIYLKSSFEVLWERVKNKKDRPLLSTAKPQETLAHLLDERSPFYEALSNKTFLTDGKTPAVVAHEILKWGRF